MEESQRESAPLRLRGRDDDSVERRSPAVQRPSREQITDVDDKRVGHRQHLVPAGIQLALGADRGVDPHLEAPGGVLGQQDRQGAVVAVRASTQLRRVHRIVGRGVVDGAEGADGVRDVGVEEGGGGQAEGDGEQAHDPDREGVHRAVVLGVGCSEVRGERRPGGGGVADDVLVGEG